MLAISLHACATTCATCWCRSTRSIRSKELIEACRNYPGLSNARRITFEYVMLDDINDSDADARELVRLLPASRPRST
jgi:23S rRNA (adenine2503-C2)-methyltransferase